MNSNGFYWSETLQQVRHLVSAGGHGGGVTGQVDVAATPDQAALFLKQRAAAEDVAVAVEVVAPAAEAAAALEPVPEAVAAEPVSEPAAPEVPVAPESPES